MNNRKDFESRLRAYLSAGARRQPPAGMEERLGSKILRRGHSWAFQLLAAAAVLIVAIGLGIGLTKARQLSGLVVKATPSPSAAIHPVPSATPSAKPSPTTATPRPGASLYPLMVPASMHMVSSTTGWASGSGTDRVLRTSDGGAHWIDLTPTGARLGTWTTFFLDASDAWLASSLQPGSAGDFTVELYRTLDGGRIWQHVTTVMADQGWPAALDFVDQSHGWLFMRLGSAAGSEGVAIYGTVDGGATWIKLSEADTSGVPGQLPVSCSKGMPVFLNASTGWVPGGCSGGGGPFLYVTRDGGQTWSDVGLKLPAGDASPCMCDIESLRFSDSRNGVFVLNIYQENGAVQNVLYTTSDAGASWRPGPVLPANAYTVFFLDPRHGWTLNAKANSLLSTSDGGQHWSAGGSVPSTQGPVDFEFITTTTGWAMGAEPAGRTILKTVNGGATWTSQLAP